MCTRCVLFSPPPYSIWTYVLLAPLPSPPPSLEVEGGEGLLSCMTLLFFNSSLSLLKCPLFASPPLASPFLAVVVVLPGCWWRRTCVCTRALEPFFPPPPSATTKRQFTSRARRYFPSCCSLFFSYYCFVFLYLPLLTPSLFTGASQPHNPHHPFCFLFPFFLFFLPPLVYRRTQPIKRPHI
jgi:hypothetical protein